MHCLCVMQWFMRDLCSCIAVQWYYTGGWCRLHPAFLRCCFHSISERFNIIISVTVTTMISWLPNQMISLILIFGCLVYVDHLYFDIQITKKYSTAMCYRWSPSYTMIMMIIIYECLCHFPPNYDNDCTNDEDGSVQLASRRPDNGGVMAAVLRTAIISISGLFKNVVAW